ncbi:hypothetical protein AVO44_05660 [Ruegeria profundi]|uniref:DDE domain-containing protein n=1 Tax=Ruegeria profundi TaxID=1685378 RepID=A0A0X3U3C3_9RHOB|nr:hypothetical protein AVO44_05660 [Ruegeria profundi]
MIKLCQCRENIDQFAALLNTALVEILLAARGVMVIWEAIRLWRAIDANGGVVDILVQTRRNAKAEKRFFKDWFRSLANYGS